MIVPRSTRDHASQQRSTTAKRRVQGHVEHPHPRLVGHVDQRGVAAEPGIVERHVNRTEHSLGLVVQGLDLRGVGDVTGESDDWNGKLGAELLDSFAKAAFVAIAQHHRRALLPKPARRRETDAGARRGCHDGDLPGEQTSRRRGWRAVRSSGRHASRRCGCRLLDHRAGGLPAVTPPSAA